MKLIIQSILVATLATLVACGSSPDSVGNDAAYANHSTARKAADNARDMVGKPYKYGGNSPSGFDCSGLVQYSYSRAGLPIPRTTKSQRQSGAAVSSQSLRAGDLLFFNQEGRKFSHVGIYIGSGKFVHAPSSGKRVRVDKLSARYWKTHFAGARRI